MPALLCDHHLSSVHPETAFFAGWTARGRIEKNKLEKNEKNKFQMFGSDFNNPYYYGKSGRFIFACLNGSRKNL